jgi:hypothetical protein
VKLEGADMEPGQEWIIGYGILILVALFYLLMPLITYRKIREEADPDPVRIDTHQTPLPPAVRDYFNRVEQILRSCGFKRVDDIAVSSQVPNIAANVRLFVNREKSDMASCTAAYMHVGSTWTMKCQYVQFATRYGDESAYVTSNCDVLLVFPPRPHVHSNQITQVEHAGRLYAVHELITREASRTRKKTLPLFDQFNGDAEAYQRWSIIAELKDATEAGYLYLAESQQAYRPTLLGAVLMTWKLLWPWKQLILLKRQRNAERILAELRAAEAHTAEAHRPRPRS